MIQYELIKEKCNLVDVKLEFPNVNGFSIRNLKNMKKFAEEYPDFEFVQSVTAQITWTHKVIQLHKQ